MRTLSISGFALRLLFAMALVFGTYNPSGVSFYHSVSDTASVPGGLPVLGLIGILLLIGWVIYVRATIRSLGVIGVSLATILFGCLIWVAIDQGLLSLDNPSVFTVVILVVLATILAIGMSWSHIRRFLTGQVDIDDVDD